MNFSTNIISTSFTAKAETEKNVVDIAEFILQTYAFKIKKKSTNKLELTPYWLSFFSPHPNALILKGKFIYDKESQSIKFKISHPFHIILNLFLLYLFLEEGNSHMLLVFPIFLCYSLVYTVINQRAIFKKILKEIEK